MSGKTNGLMKEILECEGKDNCFGKLKYGGEPLPICIPPKGEVRVMIVTEQPGEGIWETVAKTERGQKYGVRGKDPKEVINRCQSLKGKWQEILEEVVIGEVFSNWEHSGKHVPGRLQEYLFGKHGDQKIDFFDREGYYWTHFIKCPGNLRGEKGFEEEACAECWLTKEMRTLRPELVVTFGARASSWFLKKTEKITDWRELYLREIVRVAEGEISGKDLIERMWSISEKMNFHDEGSDKFSYKLCVFAHPSGKNALGHFFNEKIFEALREP